MTNLQHRRGFFGAVIAAVVAAVTAFVAAIRGDVPEPTYEHLARAVLDLRAREIGIDFMERVLAERPLDTGRLAEETAILRVLAERALDPGRLAEETCNPSAS